MLRHLSLAGLLVALALVLPALSFTCLSDSGAEADWWIAFKYPNPNNRSYSYTDSRSSGSSYALQKSSNSFKTGSKSALNYTLSQIYNKPANSLTFVLYNDDPPAAFKLDDTESDTTTTTTPQPPPQRGVRELLAAQKAHAKGVIAFDNTGQGFWLVHSVPKFPNSPVSSSSFQYMDDSQTKYAQSFLCVSFADWNSWNAIGLQMQYFRPQFYPSQVSTTAQTNAPNLYQAVDFGKYVNSAKTNVVDLRSKGGVVFKSLGKTGYYGTGYDVWDQLIAPTLQNAMQVETWRQGSGTPLPSNCTAKYKVENIDYLVMAGQTWKYTADHSKWGITTSSSSSWNCVGDINRMASQGNRGGGAVCFQNSGLHKSIQSCIKTVEAC